MKKKKILLGVLLASAAFGMAACGGNKDKPNDNPGSSDSEGQEQKASYTVKFETNGGTTVSAQSVKEGGKATMPTAPSKTGDTQYSYTFAGWYTDAALTQEYNFDTAITGEITLYAKWNSTVNQYQVTFNSKGGSAVDVQSVAYGSAASRPTDPSKTATESTRYAFAGWYTDDACTTEYDFATPITGAITLYAGWTETNKASVIFDTNGGSNIETQMVFPGEKASMPTTNPTKSPDAQYTYTFAGWYKDSGLNTVFDFNTEVIDDTTTIYAKWSTTVNEYQVTFNSMGGSAVDYQTIAYGSKVNEPTAPTKATTDTTQYTFAGWYTNEACTTAFDFNTEITGAMTLYAKWNETYKVEVAFDTNGGTNVTSQMVFPGEKASVPTVTPTKAADQQYTYEFAGWYKDSSCQTAFDFDTEVINSATTIYAKWDETPVEYTVTFVSNGSTTVGSQLITYGNKASKPTDPERDPDVYYTYTFLSWSTSNNTNDHFDFDTPITGNITLFGWWTQSAIKHTITFDTNGGNSINSQSLMYGDKVTKPADPTKVDDTQYYYTFAGWYADEELETEFDFDVAITGPVTIYAKWETTTKTYEITFDSRGGSEVSSQVVEYGMTISEPTAPTKASDAEFDYTFSGWYTSPECTIWFDFTTEIRSSNTLYAGWTETRRKYDVTFEVNGGTSIDTQNIEYGKSATEPAEPTKASTAAENYTFAGWYSDPGFQQPYDFDAAITGPTTIYVKWEAVAREYTVTFDGNGGSDIPSQQVKYGNKIIAPSAPSKAADQQYTYEFGGWSTNSLYAVFFNMDTPITSDITLYACWIGHAISYQVTFDTNGGTTVDAQSVEYGNKATQPADPTKAEDEHYTYEFVGWYSDSSLQTEFDFDTEIVGTTTIYAKWNQISKQAAEPDKFMVTFDTNGGSSVAPQQIEDGAYAAEPTEPTKAADVQYTYTFAGWYKDQGLTEEFDFSTDAITSAITLYAKWETTPVEYTITFNTDGGTEIPAQILTYGASITQPADPTKEGTAAYEYVFLGWYTNSNFTHIYKFDTTVTESMTLYAYFFKNPKQYTVTYDSNGGTAVASMQVQYDTLFYGPEDPTKAATAAETYEFAGWYKDQELTQEFDFDSDTIKGNTTLYAKWIATPVEYEVTFDTNGGTAIDAISVAYGQLITNLSNPTKESTAAYDFSFAGWYKDSGLTQAFDIENDVVTGNITLYAKWTQTNRKYDVTFDLDGGYGVDDQLIVYGQKATQPNNPYKNPDQQYIYTFVGWYADAQHQTAFDFDTAITSATTIYAKWTTTLQEYEVMFNTSGGNEIDSQFVKYGMTATEPDEPTKEADQQYTYVFIGWYSDSSLQTAFDFTTPITDELTLYANWDVLVNQYEVAFDTNGGTAINAQSVAYGSKVTKPADPSKEADVEFTYTFGGWYIDSSLLTAYDFNTTVTSAFTIYAKWIATPVQQDIETENIGYGTGYTAFTTLSASFTGTDSKNRPQLEADLTAGNFTFRTKSVLDGATLNTQGTAVDVVLPTQGSISLTGTWGSSNEGKIYVYKVEGNTETLIYTSASSYSSKSSVSVKFDSLSLAAGTYRIKGLKDSDGTGASIVITQIYYETIVQKVSVSYVANNDQVIESTIIRKGNTLTELPTLNAKSGYRFIGWYTTADFQEGTEFTTSTVVNANTTIYAKWEELTAEDIVTVSFDINVDGQSIASVDIEKGTKLSALPVLNISGYRLNGWFTDALFNNAFDVTTYVFNSDITLYAEYIKTYDVTFLDRDGNLIKTVTVDEDTKVTESISKPYIEGYKFDCWKINGTDTEFDLATEYIGSDLVLKAYYVEDTNPVAKVSITSTEGYDESATVKFATYKNTSNETADSYNIYLNGTVFNNKLLTSDNLYSTTSGSTVTAELFGLKAGTYNVTVIPVFDGQELQAAQQAATFAVTAYDRSGYAHFNNEEGVGAYNDDGTLKDNAIVLYVTDANKNTINLSFHDSVNNKDWSVTGIGNILNSAGKDNGTGANSKGGLANSNGGVILALAQNDIPLVVRFVGCVSNSGLYQTGTFNASNDPLIEGLTKYDSVDWGGSTGDNGHMARMQSGKNITFEGVGNDATIDGWGFHLICETAYSQYAKNFEVRNLTFINTPEDAIGMEGQEIESTQTITAAVERCWVHHNTFLCPNISNPAESDKSEGDGSCDFKRGRYFTCSYNYFENCHKTNLVGSSSSSVQYCLTYHHNLWYQCAARQPLARKANIHYYNNFIIGTTDTVASLRADTYMFAEKNYYLGCSRPVEYKAEGGSTGVCKSYENNVIGCFNNYDATDVTDREQTISANCFDNATGIDYSTFDTDPTKFYYDSASKCSDCYLTDANQARLDCVELAGSRYRTVLNSCEYKTSTDITSTASSATVSGATSLTIAKGKGILKVFTVTTPVTVTMTATSTAGFDTGYLLKMDGTVMLELSSSDQSTVLMPGQYVVMSCIAFTPNAKNDKETTITKCVFEEFDSEELNQQLIDAYEAAHDAIPATIEYTDACYNAIKNAMNKYAELGSALQQRITDYADVTNAYATYKSLGEAYVVGLINEIELPVTTSNSSYVTAARTAYNALINKISDASISNYSTLTTAESQMTALGVDIFLNYVDQIPANITYTSACDTAISNAEIAYESLTSAQRALSDVVTAYNTMVAARETYEGLGAIAEVDEMISSVSLSGSKAELKAVMDAYAELSSAQQAQIADANKYNSICAKYVDLLINEIPATITYSDIAKVTAARTAYNALTSTQQALVTNYSTLTAAEAAVEDLGVQSLDSYSTSDFSTEWTITGSTTSTTNGLVGDIYTGNTITAVSKFMLSSISQVSGNIYVSDKGTTTITVYTTSDLDSNNWTQIAAFTSKNNATDTPVSATVSVTGPVYVKIVMTCTKGSGKTTKLNSISFE